jgi:serine/threonine-protein kinase
MVTVVTRPASLLDPASGMLQLRTLGGLWIEGESGPLTGAAAQRRRLALLALLACVGERGVSRDKVLAFLWPESDAERGRHLLSQSVYVLRRDLGDDAILTSGDDLRLNGAVVTSDCCEFLRAAAADELEAAAGLYAGPFLDGFFLSDAPEFERWVDAERSRLAAKAVRVLESLAERAARAGDHARSADWWRRLAVLEPLSARAAVGLMTALAAAGDRGGALQHARIHEALLRSELDAAPDPEVAALAERLRDTPTPAEWARSDERAPAGAGPVGGATAALARPAAVRELEASYSPGPTRAAAAASGLPGTLAERYAVEREIGRGAMATVYLARDLRHDRFVAVKVLHADRAEGIGAARFVREMRTIARLQHPLILPLYDSGEADGSLYYVMPYVDGGSLRQRLRAERALPVAAAVGIVRDVAAALAHAHAHGVVHRDIKPENILLSAEHAFLADFGIAVSPEQPGELALTQPGAVVGTPEYMSPEQALGGTVDARGDIYSLGCVAFEMLAGAPPYSGPDPGAILAQRLHDEVPVPRGTREPIPPPVAAAVGRALARDPTLRFGNAHEFADALLVPAALGRRLSGAVMRHQRRWAAALVALAVGTVAATVVPPLVREAPLDTSMYIVLPFEHRNGAAPGLTGDKCGLLAYDALARWADLRLVSDLRVNDLRARRPGPPTFSSALELAREAGAGILVWGDVDEIGDSVIVHAALYDVARRGATIRERRAAVRRDLADVGQRFNALMDSLLLGSRRVRAAGDGALGTRSLRASMAYDSAQAALDRWDFAAAVRGLREAADADREYAHAFLWLAQVQSWMPNVPAAEWHAAAARAVRLQDRLSPRDRSLALALAALADGRFVQACELYRGIVARDPDDFIGWYGLGECQLRDRLVEPDRTSPSGWRFRASGHEAAEAYRRALQLTPSFHIALRGLAAQRAAALLLAEPSRWREGASALDSVYFAARPELDGDTVAFIPYRIADLGALRAPARRPEAHAAAYARNQAALREIAEGWVNAFPRSPEAHRALAQALELSGTVRSTLPSTPNALSETRRARELAATPELRLGLAIDAVRLALKTDDFARARREADSLLAAYPAPTPHEAAVLASAAALLGRPHRTALLLRHAAAGFTPYSPDTRDGAPVAIPTALTAEALALLGYASVGAPAESLTTLEGRVDEMLRAQASPRDRPVFADALLRRPLALAYPELGARAFRNPEVIGGLLRRLQRFVVAGDTTGYRALRDSLAAYRRAARTSDVSPEQVHREVLLALAVGDTAVAVEGLATMLDGLPTARTSLIDDVRSAGALPRTMALRAELAARRGSAAEAARWAAAAAALYASADPELALVRARLDQISRQSRAP